MRLSSIFQSIRSTVTSVILAMGLLSLAAILLTGQIYHNLTLRSQLENISQLLRQETESNLQRTRQYALQFSTLVINSKPFINHLGANNRPALQKYLASLKQSPFLLNDVLKVNRIKLYDSNGRGVVDAVFDDAYREPADDSPCLAKQGVKQAIVNNPEMEIEYDLCVKDQIPYLTASLPYVVADNHGLLVLVVDITESLQQLEQRISLPVRLRLNKGHTVFASANWPTRPDEGSFASYIKGNNHGETVFYIDAIHQDPSLDKALATARMLVISGAGVTVVLVILLVLYILNQIVVKPVNDVINSIRLVRENKNNLGAQVASHGATEITRLADDFNAMSSTLKHLYHALETMAYTDPLTRLGNRKLFQEKLQQILKSASSDHFKVALLMIDLDKFKQVNDTYGHQAGDDILVEVSNRFSTVLRNSDYLANLAAADIASPVQDHLARLGGDEFAVILPKLRADGDAVAVAKKLQHAIEQPIMFENQAIDLGISIGIAIYPDHATDMEQLMQLADQSMYHAKKNRTIYAMHSQKPDE